MPRIIALVGASGTGKTTLGKQLAADLNIPFASIDDFGRRGDHRTRWRRMAQWVQRHRGTVLIEANVLTPAIRPALTRSPSLVIELQAPSSTRAQRLRDRGEPESEVERMLPPRAIGYPVDYVLRDGEYE